MICGLKTVLQQERKKAEVRLFPTSRDRLSHFHHVRLWFLFCAKESWLQPKQGAPLPSGCKSRVSSAICPLHFLQYDWHYSKESPSSNWPTVSGIWWTSLWGIAARLHIHVTIVGQGQGLLRRRRRLSGFRWLTEKKKNRQEREADRISDSAAQNSPTWFQSLQRIPLSDSSSTQQTKYCEEHNSYLTRFCSGEAGGWEYASHCSVCSHPQCVWPTAGLLFLKLHSEESHKKVIRYIPDQEW